MLRDPLLPGDERPAPSFPAPGHVLLLAALAALLVLAGSLLHRPAAAKVAGGTSVSVETLPVFSGPAVKKRPRRIKTAGPVEPKAFGRTRPAAG